MSINKTERRAMLLVSVFLICELVYHTTCVDILAKDEKYLKFFIKMVKF